MEAQMLATNIPTTLARLSIILTLLPALTFSFQVRTIDKVRSFERLLLNSAVGPESIAFDHLGEGPYTGVSDGRVLKWQGEAFGWAEFASSRQRIEGCDGSNNRLMESLCGRPLGLQFNKATGDLYIADAYFGLMVVGPKGGLATQLATGADGGPFSLTNGLDIDQENGIVYFTDSSTRFQRRDYLWAVMSGDATGRLMKYDPKTNKVTVLIRGLAFPNGVAISKDNTFLLLAESTTCRILRYWLRGRKAGASEVFAQLPGYPDNIKKNSRGEYWVALNQEKLRLYKNVGWSGERPVAMRLSGEGRVLEELNGKLLTSISEVEERNGSLWLGSVIMPYVGVFSL